MHSKCTASQPDGRQDDANSRSYCVAERSANESRRKRPRLLWLLFRSILRMCIQNLKFVALSVPEIIGGTQKNWAVPRYAYAPFSLKFLKAFVRMDPLNISAKFEVRSFIRS